MPIVRVELWSGRTAEQKAELAKEITSSVQRIVGAPPEATYVIFTDIPKENWCQGGVMAAPPKK